MIHKALRKKIIWIFDDYIKDDKPTSYDEREMMFIEFLMAKGWLNEERLLEDVNSTSTFPRDIKDEGQIKIGGMTLDVKSSQQVNGNPKHGRFWEDGTMELEIDTPPEILEFFKNMMNDVHDEWEKHIASLENIKTEFSLSEEEIEAIDRCISNYQLNIDEHNKTMSKAKE